MRGAEAVDFVHVNTYFSYLSNIPLQFIQFRMNMHSNIKASSTSWLFVHSPLLKKREPSKNLASINICPSIYQQLYNRWNSNVIRLITFRPHWIGHRDSFVCMLVGRQFMKYNTSNTIFIHLLTLIILTPSGGWLLCMFVIRTHHTNV